MKDMVDMHLNLTFDDVIAAHERIAPSYPPDAGPDLAVFQ